ncbi:hypothetical protein PR003_g10547 [Phytophthora rubi]|uniref:Uncharacterized protein n=1 Tax=Phytophthora rubi TaxID=129364 RepID=A0A6A4FDW6_9STRA|nr:hypothetical protein PR002_g10257 [Phytophthora rubi]KAE9034412.1 hypothetical protein PR001_g9749 [Phytophthora rubi]KAE9340334.1 hypothetical protein PR003_g10547 [Phytophthora rubi]
MAACQRWAKSIALALNALFLVHYRPGVGVVFVVVESVYAGHRHCVLVDWTTRSPCACRHS